MRNALRHVTRRFQNILNVGKLRGILTASKNFVLKRTKFAFTMRRDKSKLLASNVSTKSLATRKQVQQELQSRYFSHHLNPNEMLSTMKSYKIKMY